MYQEIIHDEPGHPETVREFSAKMGISLKRMEQLIGAMLTITRLDAGNILSQTDTDDTVMYCTFSFFDYSNF